MNILTKRDLEERYNTRLSSKAFQLIKKQVWEGMYNKNTQLFYQEEGPYLYDMIDQANTIARKMA